MKRSRTALGLSSMVLGLGLLVGAAYVTGEPAFSGPTKTVVAAASAVSGGALTFVVARRLLTSPESDDRKRA